MYFAWHFRMVKSLAAFLLYCCYCNLSYQIEMGFILAQMLKIQESGDMYSIA